MPENSRDEVRLPGGRTWDEFRDTLDALSRGTDRAAAALEIFSRGTEEEVSMPNTPTRRRAAVVTSREITELADNLCHALGSHWRKDPEWEGRGAVITHKNGRRLRLDSSSYSPGQVAVFGVMPNERSLYLGEEPSVVVNPGNTAAAILEVQRLLPEYEAQLRRAEEVLAAAKAKRERRNQTISRVLAITGPPDDSHMNLGRYGPLDLRVGDSLIYVSDDGSMLTMNLGTVSVENGLSMLEAVHLRS